MFSTAQMLGNVANVNLYDVVSEVKFYSANAVDIYFQLWQSDRSVRYIPNATATVAVTFLRANTIAQTPASQTLTLSASNPFATDTSIWKVSLTAAQVAQIVGGGLQITLTEPGPVTTTIFVPMVLAKLPVTG
jgi:hypothetical protein